jgi:NAD dependent epimerase/dehydratase family enzyme
VRIVVAGSSGLIGTSLVAHLRATGHEVLRLVRRRAAAPDERSWDPPAGRIDDGTFDGVDAVVNLAGAGIGDRPWSGARKQLLRDSRNVPTEVRATAVADHGVTALLNASGINYYGDTGSQVVDETAPLGAPQPLGLQRQLHVVGDP